MPSDNTHDSRDRRDTTEKRAGTRAVALFARTTQQCRLVARQNKINGNRERSLAVVVDRVLVDAVRRTQQSACACVIIQRQRRRIRRPRATLFHQIRCARRCQLMWLSRLLSPFVNFVGFFICKKRRLKIVSLGVNEEQKRNSKRKDWLF